MNTEKIEMTRLLLAYDLVVLIANEPPELSWEKVQNQRDWWKKLAKKLIEDDNKMNETEESKEKFQELDNNF